MNSITQRVPHSPIGQYFTDSGRITAEQLQEALDYKNDQAVKLGQALTALGFVDEAELAEALRQQGKVHCINLRPEIINTQIALEFGEKSSRRFRAVAVNRISGYTTVAMEDPSDVYAIDEMSRTMKTRVLPVYAEPSKIEEAIEHVFSSRIIRRLGEESGGGERIPMTTGSGAVKLEGITSYAAERERQTKIQPIERGVPNTPSKSPEHDEERVVNMLRSMLQEAFLQGASDVHVEPRRDDVLIRFRIDGRLFDRTSLEKTWSKDLVRRVKLLAHLDPEVSHLPQDGRAQLRYSGKGVDMRVLTIPSLLGESAVLRIVDGGERLRELDSIGFSADQQSEVERMLAEDNGLLLVAGPAGSGLTTTSYSMLQQLNTRERKIVTIEDPVECQIDDATQINVGQDGGLNFQTGLRSALRFDPDVLLVGEVADADVAQAVVTASLTGHLVLSTLHSIGVAETITRLIQSGVDPFLVADSLRGVIAQRMLRRICSDCRQEAEPDSELMLRLGIPAAESRSFYEGRGCGQCNDTGFKGRIGIFETCHFGSELTQHIGEGPTLEALQSFLADVGMKTLRQDGIEKAANGWTTLGEVLSATHRG